MTDDHRRIRMTRVEDIEDKAAVLVAVWDRFVGLGFSPSVSPADMDALRYALARPMTDDPVPPWVSERTSVAAVAFAKGNLQSARIALDSPGDAMPYPTPGLALFGLLADSFDAGRRFESEGDK